MKEITVDAVIENLGMVTDFIDEILDAADCPVRTKIQINIAIDELLGNICLYAYENTIGKATVRVEKQESPEAFIITFVDYGTPYNPLESDDPDITLSADDRKSGGLGIYMVKKSMDELAYCYCDGENRLTIKKYIS